MHLILKGTVSQRRNCKPHRQTPQHRSDGMWPALPVGLHGVPGATPPSHRVVLLVAVPLLWAATGALVMLVDRLLGRGP